eukprot:TRINITY_DN1768_c0_g1_i3.p1 TRINITY_DN1768_c0_g1~~TRINITY_DN1768_c0_g1_i3.p1  ORF type:complete len:278 (-),score=11.88 TRINITY_DN1768_c0_g1_i3:29-739(-)
MKKVIAKNELIYAGVAWVKYCIDMRNESGSRAEVQKWIKESKKRYKKMLEESPQTHYVPSKNKYEQTSCVVCLGDFVNNQRIRTLKCSHIFHSKCIEGWIKEKIHLVPKCPMCNTELTKEKPPTMIENERRIRHLIDDFMQEGQGDNEEDVVRVESQNTIQNVNTIMVFNENPTSQSNISVNLPGSSIDVSQDEVVQRDLTNQQCFAILLIKWMRLRLVTFWCHSIHCSIFDHNIG